jgi:3-oxoacyl-[acyl-carrier protein] reductase
MDLKGKAIVITGAAQGLGQKMAEALAEQGANIALVDIDHVTLKETVRLCSKSGNKVKDYAVDVTMESEVVDLFVSVHKEFGSVDCVINNAGITCDGLLVKAKDG